MAEKEGPFHAGAKTSPPADEDRTAGEIARPARVPIGLELDRDVLDRFKARGRGHQTRIDAVLRRRIGARRRRAG